MRKLIIFFCLILSLNVFVHAQQQQEKPTLSIIGSARLSVKPDLGILNINVSEVKLKMAEALNALGEKSNYYNELLKKLGFKEKDIKTTGFNVSKNHVYRNNEYIDSGYIASQNIRIEFIYNQEILKKIITDFSQSEKSIDFSFGFEISEELKRKIHSQIIAMAIKDANEKAVLITKESNTKLINIKTISYGFLSREPGLETFERSQKNMAVLTASVDLQSFNLTPSDIIFQDTINISWVIE
jgi:uncharacterized protein YggE